MAEPTIDTSVMQTIKSLIDEEQSLYEQGNLNDAAITRLEALKVELDQCWDFLRQRRALREFGKDPDAARVRSASIVEKYEQ